MVFLQKNKLYCEYAQQTAAEQKQNKSERLNVHKDKEIKITTDVDEAFDFMVKQKCLAFKTKKQRGLGINFAGYKTE